MVTGAMNAVKTTHSYPNWMVLRIQGMPAKTNTLPLDDNRMWRRLLRLVHPDTHGDDELFVWVNALRDHVDTPAATNDVPWTVKLKTDELLERIDWSLTNPIPASRQQLARISKLVGLTDKQRNAWYNVAKTVNVNKSQANRLIEELENDGV